MLRQLIGSTISRELYTMLKKGHAATTTLNETLYDSLPIQWSLGSGLQISERKGVAAVALQKPAATLKATTYLPQ